MITPVTTSDSVTVAISSGVLVGSGIEAAVAAAEEEEGATFVSDVEVVHTTDDDHVITGFVLGLDRAVEKPEYVVDHGRPRGGLLPPDAAELVGPAHGEQPAQLLLLLAEKVHAEMAGGADVRPGCRGIGGAERHQRWVERHRRERVGGQPIGLSVVLGGDDADTRGVVAEHTAEVGRFDGGRGGRLVCGLGAEGVFDLRFGHGRTLSRQPRSKEIVVPSLALRTSPTPASSPLPRARSRRVSSLSSPWAGSWWNSASRRAPASLATRTA